MNRTAYSPAVSVMIDGFDGGDPWGSAMSMGFALCDVARAAGVQEVASILDYSPGMAPTLDLEEIAAVEDITADDPRLPDSLEAYCLAVAYVAGEVTDADLIRAAHVLNRYLDRCKRAGLDY